MTHKTAEVESHTKSPTIAAMLKSKATRIESLPTNQMLLHELLTLVVDIEYRCKYGETIDEQRSRGYSKYQSDEVLTDQISPVDSGLSGYQSTGDT